MPEIVPTTKLQINNRKYEKTHKKKPKKQTGHAKYTQVVVQ